MGMKMRAKFVLFLSLSLLVLFASSSTNAQQRSVFDWPWGMSCAEIERQYREGNSSDYDGRKEVLMYKINLLGRTWEARFYCHNRGLIWGDGELASLKVAEGGREIPKAEAYEECNAVALFLTKRFGEATSFTDNRKAGNEMGSVYIRFENEDINTKAILYW